MADHIEVTFVLRPPAASYFIAERLLAGTYDATQTKPAELAADAADIQAVTDFAATRQLRLVKVDAEARTVRVSGTRAELEEAKSDLKPPLDKIVIAVLGLNQAPIARHHLDGQ